MKRIILFSFYFFLSFYLYSQDTTTVSFDYQVVKKDFSHKTIIGNFDYANLKGSSFKKSSLQADFHGAHLHKVSFKGATGVVDFFGVTGKIKISGCQFSEIYTDIKFTERLCEKDKVFFNSNYELYETTKKYGRYKWLKWKLKK